MYATPLAFYITIHKVPEVFYLVPPILSNNRKYVLSQRTSRDTNYILIMCGMDVEQFRRRDVKGSPLNQQCNKRLVTSPVESTHDFSSYDFFLPIRNQGYERKLTVHSQNLRRNALRNAIYFHVPSVYVMKSIADHDCDKN